MLHTVAKVKGGLIGRHVSVKGRVAIVTRTSDSMPNGFWVVFDDGGTTCVNMKQLANPTPLERMVTNAKPTRAD